MKEPTLGRRVKIQPKGPICSRSSAEIAIESTSVHACSLHTKQKSQVDVHTPPAKPTLPTELNSSEPNQTEVNSTELNATFAQSNLRLRNSFLATTNFQLAAFPFCNTLTANGDLCDSRGKQEK